MAMLKKDLGKKVVSGRLNDDDLKLKQFTKY